MLLDNPFVSDARVEKEIEALQYAGAKITVICENKGSEPSEEKRNGIQILRCLDDRYNAPLRKGYSAYLQHCCTLILKLEFDTLHCHDFYMLSIGAAVKAKRPDIFLIYDAHEYLSGWPFYKSSKGLAKLKGKLVWLQLIRNERTAMRSADQVITITEGIAQRLMKNSGLPRLPLVIGNYPKKVELHPTKNYFQHFFQVPESTKVLIHSGTVYQDDSLLERIFDYISHQSELILVFVGNRPRHFEIEAKVAAHSSWRTSVFFHPYPQSQNQTMELISCADIGLLYVNDEWEAHRIGFSNRFVEYVMAGLPVIATPQEFTRTMNAEYACCTFYESGNFGTFEKALDTMLKNLIVLSEGAVKAGEKMNWQSEAQKLIQNYCI
ncbi:MAG: hypothetical protein A3D92_12830 [Bacteroidetes bacterium RIFCSPHIGHO2_02_FULL_44_7]|nr:MAG: hypothetical protein A3D92_12830 [Bacteroidetes bacterium RIFCSPHIGHO2_02_FULL_44_7]